MTQITNALLEPVRYSRTDFTALRAYLNRIPSARILDLYYDSDTQEALGLESGRSMANYLEHMRDDLIARLEKKNPHMAVSLASARDRGVWSKLAVDYLVGAADEDQTTPVLTDNISLWFRPVVAKRLKEEGVATLGELVALISVRGHGWNWPIPYLGNKKAAVILAWVKKHEASLGELPAAVTDYAAPPQGDLVPFGVESTRIVPLERLLVVAELDGSRGANRAHRFPLIGARNDLEAIEAFLKKYAERPKTARAYRKELERFLLWCLRERRKAMSDLLVDDCEAYMAFLADIPDDWKAVRRPRNSPLWRPFAPNDRLQPQTRAYSLRLLRTFFGYLINMRYLSGNPWQGVASPVVISEITDMQIEKALPGVLWEKMAAEGGILDLLSALPDDVLAKRYGLHRGFARTMPIGAQLRLTRAALMVLGFSGVRREELAGLQRGNLRPMPGADGVWEMRVLGKGKRRRAVFILDRVVNAFRTHWADRGDNFDGPLEEIADLPLISPIVVPQTKAAIKKHQPNSSRAAGFSPDGVYKAVTGMLQRLAADGELDLTFDERNALANSGVHSLRHTFGTQSVANGVATDVVQGLMGHASISTTSIYVQSEKVRSATEIARWQRRVSAGASDHGKQ